MFKKIIQISLNNKLIVLILVAIMSVLGIYSALHLPLDAVPDITNNQVQIVTSSPTAAPQEVEQLISFPIEKAMTNIPNVEEVRSISRYGLSVVTVIFNDDVPVLESRQYVQEQLNKVKKEIDSNLGEPELMPITTGLGEIYQYVMVVDPKYGSLYNTTELRTLHDWVVKKQLAGTKGIIEVSSFGGFLKQYEVSVNPDALKMYHLSLNDVITALQNNNKNSGASYIEKENYSYYIRMQGRTESIEDLENISIKNNFDIPVLLRNVAQIKFGDAKRYGAMTMDGKGEVVGGITLMLKGANSYETINNVKERMQEVQKTLPKGVSIYPYLDRSHLIDKTISTVSKNLIEGGIIVIIVLLILLGNFRAGLIVASVIPLSMLFSLIMMRVFGVSANLMSLGAIDFGIVVDGAVIIVEAVLHTLFISYLGKKLSQPEMNAVVANSSSKIYTSAAFGVLIILVVFVPILTLDGIEGKMFRPMAQTVGFAILGSLFLSITYVPVMASLFLNKKIENKRTFADRIIEFLQNKYLIIINKVLQIPKMIVSFGVISFVIGIFILSLMGSEFIPTLDEGDLAMQQSIKPGSSLEESIKTTLKMEKLLKNNFPEVKHVVAKIGTAEVPTDPMAIEDADVMIILKDKEDWVSASSREELADKMNTLLEKEIPYASFEFSQPIQLRFNELMTGSKADISVKIFGENNEELKKIADKIASKVENIDGVGDVKVDATEGLKQLQVTYNRQELALQGISVDQVNQSIRTAYAGEIVGKMYENEKSFDLVVRFQVEDRKSLDLSKILVINSKGNSIPVSQVASVEETIGPMLISREKASRFINIGINVRNRDIASLVEEIQIKLGKEIKLPTGYFIEYGGQYENLQNATNRLAIAVPIALLSILFILYLAFGSVKDSLLIFIAVPLSVSGGILALLIRGLPFSISAGIGFIALFGVAVLNAIVLFSAIKELEKNTQISLKETLMNAGKSRIRPVLMTALVAILGFIPMAFSNGSGAEVQRPLATVVIGGLITSTLLTLFVLPALYWLVYANKKVSHHDLN